MADLDRLGKEVAAKFLFQQRATRAAVSAATGEDRMEIDSAEVGPELTEEQHRQALDAESRVVYLMDHRGEDKCFDLKHMTLNNITELGLHLSPRFDLALRKVIDSWLAHSSATSLRPPSLICRGEKRIRAELYRVRDTYKEDAAGKACEQRGEMGSGARADRKVSQGYHGRNGSSRESSA
jgi:hypothetical protein